MGADSTESESVCLLAWMRSEASIWNTPGYSLSLFYEHERTQVNREDSTCTSGASHRDDPEAVHKGIAESDPRCTLEASGSEEDGTACVPERNPNEQSLESTSNSGQGAAGVEPVIQRGKRPRYISEPTTPKKPNRARHTPQASAEISPVCSISSSSNENVGLLRTLSYHEGDIPNEQEGSAPRLFDSPGEVHSSPSHHRHFSFGDPPLRTPSPRDCVRYPTKSVSSPSLSAASSPISFKKSYDPMPVQQSNSPLPGTLLSPAPRKRAVSTIRHLPLPDENSDSNYDEDGGACFPPTCSLGIPTSVAAVLTGVPDDDIAAVTLRLSEILSLVEWQSDPYRLKPWQPYEAAKVNMHLYGESRDWGCFGFLWPLKGPSKGMKRREEERRLEKKRQQEHNRKLREERYDKAERLWKDVLPVWKDYKGDPRVHALWREGLPQSVRNSMWPTAIGNDLSVTQDLFNIKSAEAEAYKKVKSAQRAEAVVLEEVAAAAQLEMAIKEAADQAVALSKKALDDATKLVAESVTMKQLVPQLLANRPNEKCSTCPTVFKQVNMLAGYLTTPDIDLEVHKHALEAAQQVAAKSEAMAKDAMVRASAALQSRKPDNDLLSDDEDLFDKLERFQYLGASKEASIAIIPLDVERTFPTYKFFVKDAGTLHNDLCQVLEAYAFYRPDVGYVQGMSYLAGFFLLAMDKIDAFTCFANLLNQHFFRSLFRMNTEELQCHYDIFRMLLEVNALNIKQYFELLELETGFRFEDKFLMEWIFSLYTKVLHPDVATRVWDNFFLDGEVFIYRTAVAILQIMEPSIVGYPVEDVCATLKAEVQHIDEITLFCQISKVEVSREVKQHVHSAEGAYYCPHFMAETDLARLPPKKKGLLHSRTA